MSRATVQAQYPDVMATRDNGRGEYAAGWGTFPDLVQRIGHTVSDQMHPDALASGGFKELIWCGQCGEVHTAPPDESCPMCLAPVTDQMIVGWVERRR